MTTYLESVQAMRAKMYQASKDAERLRDYGTPAEKDYYNAIRGSLIRLDQAADELECIIQEADRADMKL